MRLDCFLSKVEAGYGNHSNQYHNATHGADVTQTVHYLIHSTGFEVRLLDIQCIYTEITTFVLRLLHIN